MASSGMLSRLDLVRTYDSEELSASFIRVTRITASTVPSSPIFATLMKEALRSSENPVLTIATQLNTPEDAILRSHRRGNLKSYEHENVYINMKMAYIRKRKEF
jgi:phospholipid N-methyltransferase